MRKAYDKQLNTLHTSLIQMGAFCEDSIACAVKALLDNDTTLYEKVVQLEDEIDALNRNIEQQCVRLLLHQQPMASDLRQITVAQKMITDMERIGDQALDIAELYRYAHGSNIKNKVEIAAMARATIGMVTGSVDAFVKADAQMARQVVAEDDVVDGLFLKIKQELAQHIKADTATADECLDLLMVAKYFERIGDHAVNIAQWVLYFITGSWTDEK